MSRFPSPPKPLLLSLAISLALVPTPAKALSHLWIFSELYSDASGDVQFIELLGESHFQNFLDTFGNTISSTAFPLLDVFTADLVDQLTQDRFLLIGSSSYAALGGVPAPDFTMPDGFFSVLGDTVSFQDATSLPVVVTFTGADLPTDGALSLHIDHDGNFSQAPNSPTNFAGQTGSIVPEPSAALLCLGGLLAIVRRRAAA